VILRIKIEAMLISINIPTKPAYTFTELAEFKYGTVDLSEVTLLLEDVIEDGTINEFDKFSGQNIEIDITDSYNRDISVCRSTKRILFNEAVVRDLARIVRQHLVYPDPRALAISLIDIVFEHSIANGYAAPTKISRRDLCRLLLSLPAELQPPAIEIPSGGLLSLNGYIEQAGRVFILCHEIGHLIYSPEDSRSIDIDHNFGEELYCDATAIKILATLKDYFYKEYADGEDEVLATALGNFPLFTIILFCLMELLELTIRLCRGKHESTSSDGLFTRATARASKSVSELKATMREEDLAMYQNIYCRAGYDDERIFHLYRPIFTELGNFLIRMMYQSPRSWGDRLPGISHSKILHLVAQSRKKMEKVAESLEFEDRGYVLVPTNAGHAGRGELDRHLRSISREPPKLGINYPPLQGPSAPMPPRHHPHFGPAPRKV
jgi:hypothetical protein